MIDSLYKIQLDISDYNLIALNDFMRLLIIQLTPQVLFYLTENNFEFFNPIIIKTIIYLLLGVLLYWLVFNQLFVFTNKDTVDKDDYFQTNYSKDI
tara:strand:+ start:346 stop:633 length:288 start_codon:yes stop_codon:yes gene_type:complete